VGHDFRAEAPHLAIPALLDLEQRLGAIPDEAWRTRKQREVRELIVACAGLFADATAADHRVAPGGEIEVTATVVDRSPVGVRLKEVRFPGLGGERIADGRALAPPAPGAVGVPVEIKRKITIAADAAATTPYWLASAPEVGLYPVANPRDIGKPEDDPTLAVDFQLEIAGRGLTVSRPIAYKWTDPVAGERYRPLEIAPLVSVAPDTKVLLFPERRKQAAEVKVRLTAGAASVSGVLRPEAPEGWSVEPAATPFKLDAKGAEAELAFRVQRAAAPSKARARAAEGAALAPPPSSAATLRFVAEVGDARLARAVMHV